MNSKKDSVSESDSPVIKKSRVKLKIMTAQFDYLSGPMIDLFAKRLIDAGMPDDELEEIIIEDDEDIADIINEIHSETAGADSGNQPQKKRSPDNKIKMVTEADMYEHEDGNISIEYEETEISGMEGSVTKICFNKKQPDMITMLRGGAVYTALIFENHKRHICAYETPYMPFELCVYSLSAKNTVSRNGGKIILDYILQVRGASTQRTKMLIDVSLMKNQN